MSSEYGEPRDAAVNFDTYITTASCDFPATVRLSSCSLSADCRQCWPSLQSFRRSSQRNSQKCRRWRPRCRLTPPPRGTPASIRIYLIFLETRIIDLHYAADMGLSSHSIFFLCMGSVKRIFSARLRISCLSSSKVIDFGTNRKRVYYFLLVGHSNLCPVAHRSRGIARFLHLTLFRPNCTRSPMLGSDGT